MSKNNKEILSDISDSQIQNRAIGLFTFLRELTELRTKAIRTIDQYEKVLWFTQIPNEQGCYCRAFDSGDNEEQSGVWVEIKKPYLKPFPEIPESLEPWLDRKDVGNSSLEFPSLREHITISTSDESEKKNGFDLKIVTQELDNFPEIRKIWENYIKKDWGPWAEKDRRLKAIQEVYNELFLVYQNQQRLGEVYEVVLGLGYLTWKTPSGQEVRRHIITAQASLIFDSTRGVITVIPAGEGAKPTIEQDMLEPQERPEVKEQKVFEQQIEEIEDNLWDNQIQNVLKGWTNALSAEGCFDKTFFLQETIDCTPRVNLAPALILRKRTERSLNRVFREIIDQLSSEQSLPMGVKRLVTIIDDSADITKTDTTEGTLDKKLSPIEEVYFPLLANEEQREIARKILVRQGVLVQGPPGTGKSQTIANLVCHLLATGQRVLVTSHAPRALKVLQKKFPKEIANLCVVLLGNDLNAMQALEDSVREITDRFNTWNPKENKRSIINLEKELDKYRREEQLTLNEIRAIREAETYRHPRRFGVYEGTAQQIANQVGDEQQHYSWVSAKLKEEDEPPLTDTEAMELTRLLREIDDICEKELAKKIIDPDSLINPVDFAILVKSENQARELYENVADYRNCPEYIGLKGLSLNQRKELAGGLTDLGLVYETLKGRNVPWVNEAATQILAGQFRPWNELLTVTKKHLNIIGDCAHSVTERHISGLEERSRDVVKTHAMTLLKHIESGGKLGFGIFRPKVVKDSIYLIKEVRVDGCLCDNLQSLEILLEWINVADQLDYLDLHWTDSIKLPSGSFVTRVAGYRDLCELLEKVLGLRERVSSLEQIVSAVSEPVDFYLNDLKAIRRLIEIVNAIELEEKLAEAKNRFDEIEKLILAVEDGSNVHSVVDQTLQAVKDRDEQKYKEVYHTLCNLQKTLEGLSRRCFLFQRLKSVAPGLASELKSSFDNKSWDKRMIEFTTAWNWARASFWLEKMYAPGKLEQLSKNLKNHQSRIRVLIGKLAAAKAWEHCLSKLTEHERQHLIAWSKAIGRIGKGTGKYAGKNRRDARKNMEECRSAIQAWVMPIYRVAETFTPGKDTFDVVIIDEASQSGPEALFLQYLAKKIIVVGDDKQISPDSVGINREAVELLRQHYLSKLPRNDAFGADNSFFDLADICYGGRIRLREHFRCMPEIIQFSNDLCYRSEPLIPLRQYGANRLSPVVARYISDGYIKGKRNVINPPEAQAIVDEIKRCCGDLAYKSKSMGVISLLGSHQAQYIESLLLQELGPEEIEKRQLVCGDAYAFQGDERDIIFLSMVSAPDERRRIGALGNEKAKRRFNVAVSRAKDQIWLFHSATLNDLSPRCLRHRLLEYFQNPKVEPTKLENLNIEGIKDLVEDREVDPPYPFDSWFEVDVFQKITKRGYRVIPQHEVAGYRIDLVVEGMQGRLAVECDGDTWHGAERYEEDMGRQRTLERCGWVFWRVRGSAFYRDPEAALEGLWKKLDKLGIHPTSQGTRRDSSSTVFAKQISSEKTISLNEKSESICSAKKKEIPNKASTDNHKVEVNNCVDGNGTKDVSLITSISTFVGDLNENECKKEVLNFMDDNSILVCSIPLNDYSKLVFYVWKKKGRMYAEMRKYLFTKSYAGPTKSGLVLRLECLVSLIDVLNDLATLIEEKKNIDDGRVGIVEKSKTKRIVVSLVESSKFLDIREHVSFGTYKGPTRKGVRVLLDHLPVMIDNLKRLADYIRKQNTDDE